MITVERFHKAYDTTVAVADLSFEVEAGQILGLVGPNGAGKTTTLKALCGIIPPSRGRLSVDGYDLATDPVAVKSRLAYISDDPQLFADLSVNQHLAFTASAYQVSDARAKTSELLEMFALTDKCDVPARQLSRGMRQKLALCCGYLHDPVAILYDEPLTGLDPLGIRVLKDSIVRRAQSGAAVIVSSHLLAMVEDICTHMLVLESGRRRFFGTVDELKSTFAESGKGTSLEEVFFLATGPQDPSLTCRVTM